MTIADNLRAVRAEIAAACQAAGRDPNEVSLIAVTKSQDPQVLPALAAEGALAYGENRIEHLMLMAKAAPGLSTFHHIGRLQSRQFPWIVQHAAVVHGLADLSHVARLDRAAADAGKNLGVFCQVNVYGEVSKAGVGPDDLGALCDAVRACSQLTLFGLMTMAPELDTHANADQVQACFAQTRALAQQQGLSRLSMGMSGDMALAIAEGATEVRIGSRLFVP